VLTMSKQRKPQLPKTPTPPAASGDPEVEQMRRAEQVRRLVADGARLLAAKRPGEAVPKLEEALSLDPENVSAAINLGGAFILQGKHNRAVPALEIASRLEPDNAMVWSNLAAAYLGKLPFSDRDRQDRAIVAYERALITDPRTPNVHYNLGLVYLERDDPLRAAAHFLSAVEIDPDDRDAQLWLDRIRRGEGGPADASPTGDG
jgi:tetratricopeptide (TPR) repeat protein